jgi:hypothetical protein
VGLSEGDPHIAILKQAQQVLDEVGKSYPKNIPSDQALSWLVPASERVQIHLQAQDDFLGLPVGVVVDLQGEVRAWLQRLQLMNLQVRIDLPHQ